EGPGEHSGTELVIDPGINVEPPPEVVETPCSGIGQRALREHSDQLVKVRIVIPVPSRERGWCEPSRSRTCGNPRRRIDEGIPEGGRRQSVVCRGRSRANQRVAERIELGSVRPRGAEPFANSI